MAQPVTDVKVRLLSMVAIDLDNHWMWTGATDAQGYGRVRPGGLKQPRRAHQVAYAEFIGPVPAGYVLAPCEHSRLCVNPQHLRLIARSERSTRPAPVACPAGHRGEIDAQGRCRVCRRERARAGRAPKPVRVPDMVKRLPEVRTARTFTPYPEFFGSGKQPCADSHTVDLFQHGERGLAARELDRWAKAVCEPCPFKARCLQWAIDNDETEGVWGGTTADERGHTRQQRSVQAAREVAA